MRWRLFGGDQWSVFERVRTGSAAVHRSTVEPCQSRRRHPRPLPLCQLQQPQLCTRSTEAEVRIILVFLFSQDIRQ